GRQLPQNRSELVGQLEDAGGQEVGQGHFDVVQLLVVGDEPAAFDGVDEVVGSRLVPPSTCRRGSEAIERAVDLDAVEDVGGVLEFSRLGQSFRIESLAPAGVVPTGDTDPDLAHSGTDTRPYRTENRSISRCRPRL